MKLINLSSADNFQDKGFLIEVEFIDAMLTIKLLGLDTYSSQSVQVVTGLILHSISDLKFYTIAS